MLLIITYIVQIYYNSGVTHFLPHNEHFIEKTTLEYQHTLVDFHFSRGATTLSRASSKDLICDSISAIASL